MPPKGYSFQSYDNDTFQFLYQLHKKGIINDQNYIKFSECKTFKHLLDLTREQFKIKEELFDKIWKYLHQSWTWKRGEPSECTVFNEWQSIFMRELLRKNGVITREECLNSLFTDQQFRHITVLEEMNYLKSIQTNQLLGRKIIYIINPEIVIECQN